VSKVDGRKIPHSVREQIRFEAMADWQQGLAVTAVAAKYGTSRKIVYQWIDRYREGGYEALKTKPGIGRGQQSKVTQEQKERLHLTLRIKTPIDYGYQTPLWTCQIVAQLINDEFQVSYSPNSIGKILHRLGFSPQKPRWGAWQQDAKKKTNG